MCVNKESTPAVGLTEIWQDFFDRWDEANKKALSVEDMPNLYSYYRGLADAYKYCNTQVLLSGKEIQQLIEVLYDKYYQYCPKHYIGLSESTCIYVDDEDIAECTGFKGENKFMGVCCWKKWALMEDYPKKG